MELYLLSNKQTNKKKKHRWYTEASLHGCSAQDHIRFHIRGNFGPFKNAVDIVINLCDYSSEICTKQKKSPQ